MKFIGIQKRHGTTLGVLVGGEALDLSACGDILPAARAWPPSLRGLLEIGNSALDAVRRITDEAAGPSVSERLRANGSLTTLDRLTLAAPVPEPGMILSCGMNYHEHLKEMNTPVPDKPTAFYKSITAIIGPGAPIVLPKLAPDMVDWEGEFSVVIGKRCYAVPASDAMDHVAGYTIVNDVSARDWVEAAITPKEPQVAAAGWRLNHLGKQFPTFSPMGPVMLVRENDAPAPDLQLTTRLNGKVMQSARTGDLIFSVGETIAWFSRWYRFMPGDIVTTGSPDGVGYARNPKVFMKHGDVVEVEVEGIGVLSNPIRNARPAR